LVFLLFDLFTIGIVAARAPISLQSYAMRKGNYNSGTPIGGIIWDSHFTDLRVAVTNPTDDDYESLDLVVQPDQWSHKAAILTESSGCDLSAIDGNVISFAIAKESGPLTLKATRVGAGFDMQDSSGNTYTSIATESGYRLRCGKLPAHFTIRIVFAVVGVSSLWKTLQVPQGPLGTWGMGMAEFSGGSSLFDLLDPRPFPSRLTVKGGYLRKLKPFTVVETITVGDSN
jgi:hypothetical protein